MTLVGSWQRDQYEVHEQFFFLAKAFLESAGVLCERLISWPEELNFDRGRVVISVTYHAVELFLKAAVLRRKPEASLHHNLEVLKSEYDELYHGERYQFEVPFGIKVLGFDLEEVEKIKKDLRRRMPSDQLTRYPINKSKEIWPGVQGFEPEEFREIINRLELDFRRLETVLFERQLTTLAY